MKTKLRSILDTIFGANGAINLPPEDPLDLLQSRFQALEAHYFRNIDSIHRHLDYQDKVIATLQQTVAELSKPADVSVEQAFHNERTGEQA